MTKYERQDFNTQIEIYEHFTELTELLLNIDTELELDLESGNILSKESMLEYREKFDELSKKFTSGFYRVLHTKTNVNVTQKLINTISEKLSKYESIIKQEA